MQVKLALRLTKSMEGGHLVLSDCTVNYAIKRQELAHADIIEARNWFVVPVELDGRKQKWTKDDIMAGLAHEGYIRKVGHTMFGGIYEDLRLGVQNSELEIQNGVFSVLKRKKKAS